MMVSGSVSLELLARNTPAAVLYRVGRILHTYAKLVVNVNSITLVNLMAGRTCFQRWSLWERLNLRLIFLTESVGAMLQDDYYLKTLHQQMGELRQSYAVPGASKRAATALLEQLDWAKQPRQLKTPSEFHPPMRRAA